KPPARMGLNLPEISTFRRYVFAGGGQRLHLSLPLAVLRIAASAEIRLMRFCGWGGNLLRRQDAGLRLARDIELVNAACHLRLAA
ncbi:hypothetical protein, partial [Chromobacterium piscinae]|uniref:hypothetical protein n=1 Tax=Chromobacterium piscinae TaxID=686831 RepID=UPI00320A925A